MPNGTFYIDTRSNSNTLAGMNSDIGKILCSLTINFIAQTTNFSGMLILNNAIFFCIINNKSFHIGIMSTIYPKSNIGQLTYLYA